MEIDFTNLQDVLKFLAGPAGMIAWGTAVSDHFRNLKVGWFVSLRSQYRQLVVYAAYAAMPVLAFAILNYIPTNIIESLAPFFALVAMVFISGRAAFGLAKMRE